jgi:hypothetical protein
MPLRSAASARRMANSAKSCESMLPKVALQLGNPTITFTDRTGRRLTVRDGRVLPEK